MCLRSTRPAVQICLGVPIKFCGAGGRPEVHRGQACHFEGGEMSSDPNVEIKIRKLIALIMLIVLAIAALALAAVSGHMPSLDWWNVKY